MPSATSASGETKAERIKKFLHSVHCGNIDLPLRSLAERQHVELDCKERVESLKLRRKEWIALRKVERSKTVTEAITSAVQIADRVIEAFESGDYVTALSAAHELNRAGKAIESWLSSTRKSLRQRIEQEKSANDTARARINELLTAGASD